MPVSASSGNTVRVPPGPRLKFDRLPVGVADAARDDQGVAGVLLEQLVRLDVQRVRRHVPDGLIDADDLAAAFFRRGRVIQFDQEDGAVADRGQVERAAERDRQARLDIETVERVDDADVVVVRRVRGAVGQREVDPPAGELVRIGDRESVARERAALAGVQVERRERARNAAVFQGFQARTPGSGARCHDKLLARTKRSAVSSEGHPSRRADRAPGRCRADGGLLGGKDPTGRFVSSSGKTDSNRRSRRCRDRRRAARSSSGWSRRPGRRRSARCRRPR